LKNYRLVALTGVWLADGIPRIMTPPLLHRTGSRMVIAVPGEIAARFLAILRGVFANFIS